MKIAHHIYISSGKTSNGEVRENEFTCHKVRFLINCLLTKQQQYFYQMKTKSRNALKSFNVLLLFTL